MKVVVFSLLWYEIVNTFLKSSGGWYLHLLLVVSWSLKKWTCWLIIEWLIPSVVGCICFAKSKNDTPLQSQWIRRALVARSLSNAPPLKLDQNLNALRALDLPPGPSWGPGSRFDLARVWIWFFRPVENYFLHFYVSASQPATPNSDHELLHL